MCDELRVTLVGGTSRRSLRRLAQFNLFLLSLINNWWCTLSGVFLSSCPRVFGTGDDDLDWEP